MSTPESITEAELAGALAELGIRINGSAYFPELARNIFGYIERQRREPEPVYAVGDLFEDADRKQWYRVGGDLPWRHVPTGFHHGEDRPKRPLRKLVPEGSHEAAAILVAEWRGLGEQDDAVPAWRGGYRAALRKCADELEYALKQGGE